MQATTLNKNKITIPFTPVKEWKKEVQEFSSSIKNLSTSLVNVLGSICEESVSASPLSEKEIATLVEDSANASGAVIHQVLSNAIYNDSTYNYCINMLSTYKSEKELDIIISALSRHPVDYFEKTMQYALDEKLGKYIRYYLIEAIGKWYAIDENNRKDALRKILENTPNNYIKTVVQQTMEEF